MTTKTERCCPTCGSDNPRSYCVNLRALDWECPDPFHTVSSEASPTVARQVPEWALKAALEIWEDNHLEPENATEDSIKERNCKLWAEIVARHAAHAKLPIDRPCSACSAGDSEMEHH